MRWWQNVVNWEQIKQEYETKTTDLKELAEKYNVKYSTLRSRKSREKWGTSVATNDENVATRNRGGQQQNQNAKGNKGGKAPPNNKNALKTGEHETIFADTLSTTEMDFYSTMSEDPFFIMSEEVRLLKIRQLRMMQRIKNIEDGMTESEFEYLQELRGRTKLLESTRKSKSELELVMTEVKEKATRKIDDILRIEDALTRVSNQLQKAIKQLNELSIADQRLELMRAQTDHTKAQTTKALINKDGDETDGGTVINIIDDIG